MNMSIMMKLLTILFRNVLISGNFNEHANND